MIAAIVACVALVAVAFLLLRRQAQSEAALIARHAEAERTWADERRELLNRIQRPEILTARPAEPFVLPDPEPDELALVGTIDISEGDDE